MTWRLHQLRTTGSQKCAFVQLKWKQCSCVRRCRVFVLFHIIFNFIHIFSSTISRVRRPWRIASRGRSRHFTLLSRAQRHPSFRRYACTFPLLPSLSLLEYTIEKCSVHLMGVRAGTCQTNKEPTRLSADINCCSVPTQTKFSSPVN